MELNKDFLEKYNDLMNEDVELALDFSLNALKKSNNSDFYAYIDDCYMSLDEFDKEHMQDLFEHPSWEDLSKACLGCGSCTFICPTCQCYDIREYDNGKGIQRYRCWDSCMYHDFTMMAHGTPRPTQKERFRQRFMHKLVYHPSNHDGVYACVGCGRCVKKCPINMNIIKVIQTLKGGMNE